MSSDVVPTTPVLSDEQRTEIRSFEDALATLADAGISVQSASDFGDGFGVMDKSEFVNRKFLLLDCRIIPGDKSDFGSDFAILRIVATDGTKAILTDGSRESGLCPQVKRMMDRGVSGGVMCEKGLTVSEYTYTDEKGKETPAKTYYIHGM